MSEGRSAFAKARSIADTYWASFAKAEAASARVEREATNRYAVTPTPAARLADMASVGPRTSVRVSEPSRGSTLARGFLSVAVPLSEKDIDVTPPLAVRPDQRAMALVV